MLADLLDALQGEGRARAVNVVKVPARPGVTQLIGDVVLLHREVLGQGPLLLLRQQ
jgi:hypothetical protein